MIWILGASGYIGEAFVAEVKKRKLDYRSVSRRNLDYTDFRTLLGALKKEKSDFVVNAAVRTNFRWNESSNWNPGTDGWAECFLCSKPSSKSHARDNTDSVTSSGFFRSGSDGAKLSF